MTSCLLFDKIIFFQQKARDNRAYLKSSRRDTVDPHDLEEQEDEEKALLAQLQGGMYGMSPENRSSSIGMDAARMPHASHQQQGIPQGMMRVPSTSPITAPDFGNFAKPKPLSRFVSSE